MTSKLLILGCAGLVGAAVTRRSVTGRTFESVVGLAHKTAPDEASQPNELVWGDAGRPRFGLSRAVYDDLLKSTTHLVVATGSVGFEGSVATVRDQHLLPIDQAIAFAAAAPGPIELCYVSSIVAAGSVRGHKVRSQELPQASRLGTVYEWAKFNGEGKLRSSGLPFRVLRPGHVLPSDPDRRCERFGIFDMVPLLERGLPIPCPDGRYWITTDELVADCALAVMTPSAPLTAVNVVDPRSPTWAAALTALGLGLARPPRFVAGDGLVAKATKFVSPGLVQRFAPELPSYVLRLSARNWDLDTSCIQELVDSGHVALPPDLTYFGQAIDSVSRELRFA